jgi:O-antigen ligase
VSVAPGSARLHAAADRLHLVMLATLPLIGVGCVHALLGVDTGAGFQPAYLLLAAGVALRIVGGDTVPAGASARGVALVLAAVAVSAVGVATERSLLATPAQAWWRFAKQTVQLGLMLVFLMETAMWTRGEGRWAATARWLAAGLAVQVAYAAWQAVAFYHPHAAFTVVDGVATSNPAILSGSEELYVGGRMSGLPRVRGTAAEPLYLASYVLAIWPVVWSELRGRVRTWLLTAGFLLLLATWSRGALLGLAVGGSCGLLLLVRAGLVERISRRGAAIAAGAAAGLLLVVALALGPRALWLPVERIVQATSGQDWSNLTRYYSFQAAWRGFLASPLVGLGWGQFGFHFPLLVDPLGLQSQFTWPVVNSLPLLVLCETGLVGAVVVAGLSARAVRSVLRATAAVAARRDPSRARRVAALAGGTVAGAVQLLTFSQYNLPHIWVGWGLLAAALCDREPGWDRHG